MAGRKKGEFTQTERVFQVLAALRAHHFGVETATLAERFDTSEKQLGRDLAVLSRCGFETEKVSKRGEKKKVRLAEKPLEPVHISMRERFALMAVRRVFDVLRDTPLHQDVESLYGKILSQLPAPQQHELEQHADRFVFLPNGGPKHYAASQDVLDGLLTGLLRDLRIDYRYRSASGSERDGVLEPHALVLYRHGLYVIGTDPERDESPRVFAAERFTHAAHRKCDKFERNAAVCVDDYFQGAFGIFVSGEHTEVTVDFTADVAHLIRARTWHPSQQLEDQPGGGVRMTFAVAHTAEVLPWILSWGPRARLVGPAELVAKVRDALAATAQRYAKGESERPGIKSARPPAAGDDEAASGVDG